MQTLLSPNPVRSELSTEIEQVRTHMVDLACKFGFLHPDVQQCSEHLDGLLIRYYEINRSGGFDPRT